LVFGGLFGLIYGLICWIINPSQSLFLIPFAFAGYIFISGGVGLFMSNISYSAKRREQIFDRMEKHLKGRKKYGEND